MSAIKAENLTLAYGKGTFFEKTAVSDMSFAASKGEFVGIIGRTGSGKSTLVQLMNGLIKPDKGRVCINGTDIWEKPRKVNKIRFNVGAVFQYPEYQLFEETVYKDISFGPKNMGLCGDEIDKRVKSAAEFVGLSAETLDRSPFELSGGEKRRVAIAGIIAMDPDILILDEPTAGLDPHTRGTLLNQIKNYHNIRKNTVFLISHSMEDIALVSDKILVLNNGKKVMYDTVGSVFSRGAELEKIGLRVPQITRIMLKLRQKGIDINTNVFTTEQAFDEIVNYIERKKEC